MKQEKQARKHSSNILEKLLAKITPKSQFQTNTRMNVAARIDDLINAKGWGKSELAQKLDKNPSEVTKWLSGTQNFTIDTLSEIAFVMDIPVSELFVPVQIQLTGSIHITISYNSHAATFPYHTPFYLDENRINDTYQRVPQINYTSLSNKKELVQ